jgi:hypothetical protein
VQRRALSQHQRRARVAQLVRMPVAKPGLLAQPREDREKFSGSIGVLDERLQPLGMCDREPESHRAAVVLHDEGVLGQPESLGESPTLDPAATHLFWAPR